MIAFGYCLASRSIAAWPRWEDPLSTIQNTRSAEIVRVFWIVDNGSSHRGQAAIDRLAKQYPNAIMVRTPGAHLLAEPNRDLLLHRPTKSSLAEQLHEPRRGHRPPIRLRSPLQPDRHPFKWKFTTTDLANLLDRWTSIALRPCRPRAGPGGWSRSVVVNFHLNGRLSGCSGLEGGMAVFPRSRSVKSLGVTTLRCTIEK